MRPIRLNHNQLKQAEKEQKQEQEESVDCRKVSTEHLCIFNSLCDKAVCSDSVDHGYFTCMLRARNQP